ncbi:unnamed protein product [Durusdinium trenchii]|uniref:Peptidase C1A papain C-terminal domain-containing protein n=1 Tax=Durusdinium trenchii TaxID=1381693 RepID=A0ABP0SSK8_9DINO
MMMTMRTLHKALKASNHSNPTAVPNDRTIVDVSGFARHEHQHFFNETVCYTFDLFPGEGVMLPSQWQWKHLASHGQLFRNDKEEDKDDDEEEEKPPENRSDDINATEKSIMMKKEIKKLIFLSAMSDVFGAPLQFYDRASAVEGVQQIAGKHCTVWQLNESRTMRMGRLVEAGDGTEGCSELVNASCKAGEWASLFLRHSLGDRPSIQLQSLLTQRAGLGRGLATMTAIFDFCVTEQGELLSTEALYKLTYQRKADETHNETRRTNQSAVASRAVSRQEAEEAGSYTVFERKSGSKLIQALPRPNGLELSATFGVAGGECVNLKQGRVGQKELDAELNGKDRLQRINREASGHWEADAYDFWDGVKVKEMLPSLGTEMGPLKLPLRSASGDSVEESIVKEMRPMETPAMRDVAVSDMNVMTDRFCVAAMQHQSWMQIAASDDQLEDLEALCLSPELMVQCDDTNNGCGGGRLDDAWIFLKNHGIPKETCAPYMHCPVPIQRSCEYGWEKRPFIPLTATAEQKKEKKICFGRCADGSSMSFFKVGEAYAAARPRDVQALQREVMQGGPVEVAFFVFSDFMSYRSGVYFRTPGAYGPLGGHAVRLLGWGTQEELKKEPVDYWLLANSYSPLWGMHGLFKMRRGQNECGIESTPAAGTPDLDTLFPVKAEES